MRHWRGCATRRREPSPGRARAAECRAPEDYWSLPLPALADALGSSAQGLTGDEAARRLVEFGPNRPPGRARLSALRLLLSQFRSPLTLVLVFAAAISLLVREWVDAAVVLAIVAGGALLTFWREYGAGNALARLLARVTLTTTAVRDGVTRCIPASEVVPGDVVLLAAGSLVPADGVLIEAADCHVSQAALTGEPFPVEKRPGPVPRGAALSARHGCVYQGTNVQSGLARVLVVRTGGATEFGRVAERLRSRPPETEFDRGLRNFGALITHAMSLLVLVVFAVNVIYGRPVVDALLFSVALAVGLAPELLPAILGYNLARSAQAMAGHGVLVRRLPAIENLGSMDLLCTDKTGTLTEGVVRLDAALGAGGEPCQRVLRLAVWNARLQTGLPNPLDPAIVARAPADAPLPPKLAEVPYDFVRRRVSVVVESPDGPLLVTKGAFDGLVAACDRVALGEAEIELDADRAADLHARFAAWSAEGYRVLGVAAKLLAAGSGYGREVECGLVFHGFLLFLDPPKPGVRDTVAALAGLGVRLKIVTGDNGLVAAHVAGAVGIASGAVLSGADLVEMSDEALGRAAETVDLFVEVDPNQKERIVRLLRRGGHVVGYLGDGINDAPALHAADVGLSVEGAVDVAREAADFVLLEPDLDVLRRGILEGRTTFANTLKYVLTTESANLGNMVSMAAASLFLPFLPLLAKQILLNNFLSDVPAMAIASDRVDRELIARPRRWDLGFVRRFMVEFGLLSSCFDLCTFAVLIYGFGASEDRFRTAWFVESLLTELVVALIVRTRRPAWQSRPSAALLWSTAGVAVLTFALPWLPGARLLGLVPLEAPILAAIVVITLLYAASAELVKASFYRRAEASAWAPASASA